VAADSGGVTLAADVDVTFAQGTVYGQRKGFIALGTMTNSDVTVDLATAGFTMTGGALAEINAIEYEPRTLRADTKLACGVRLETNLCIDVGLRLAEALDHLHELGLAHRDVKPANVIFVNGKAKLADIGLVAEQLAHGAAHHTVSI
jgi:hypothetical protein